MEKSKSAIEKLYLEYYYALYAYAKKLVSAEHAHDIVVDVFVQMYNNSNHFESEHRDAKTYLYRSVRNKCVDILRRITAERKILIEGDDCFYPDMDITPITIGALHKAIEQLPPRMKDIIKLGFISHYSNEEIAAMLGISHQSVRNQKVTALKKLRASLQEVLN